jgi:hypothetical protein
MIIGGQAVLQYGEARLTKDVDVTLGVDIDQYKTIIALLKDKGFRLLSDSPEQFVKRTNVLPFAEKKSGVRVDMIFSDSEYERTAINRAKKIRIGGRTVSFAAIEDVVIQKLVANRPRDLEDVAGILAHRPKMDREYLVGWLKDFEAIVDHKVLHIFETLEKNSSIHHYKH